MADVILQNPLPSWNIPLLHQQLPPEDVIMILFIPLPPSQPRLLFYDISHPQKSILSPWATTRRWSDAIFHLPPLLLQHYLAIMVFIGSFVSHLMSECLFGIVVLMHCLHVLDLCIGKFLVPFYVLYVFLFWKMMCICFYNALILGKFRSE